MELSTWEVIKSKLTHSHSGKYATIGLAAILVMVAVVAGSTLFDTATASKFQIDHEQAEAQGEAASVDAQESQSIFVDVSGAVKEPGLVELEPGARVAAAIEACGGFTKDALGSSINQARVLQDGEQVVVASKQEVAAPAQSMAVPEDAGAVSTTGGPINLNSATSEQLQSLPGIGESTASKIVADRQQNGPYATVDDITRVSGIGEKKLESLRDLVCV